MNDPARTPNYCSIDPLMRIAQVTHSFPPYFAGVGNVCFHNARVLASLGHEVHVFTAQSPGEAVAPRGVAVHRLRPLFEIGKAPLLPKLVALPRFDLIHLHLPFIFGGELVLLRALAGRTPLVVTVHNDLRIDGAKGMLLAAYDRLATPLLFRGADVICVVSEGFAESLPAIDAARKRMQRIVELPNGVDEETFRPGIATDVRTKLGIPAEAFLIAVVAALDYAHPSKRIDLALRALSALPETRLLVVGGGPLAGQLEELARELGVADRVHFAGAVTHDEVAIHLAACDCLALTSDRESFGMVLLEAMACGKPVISSDLPGPAAIVRQDGCGVLFRSGDAEDLVRAIRQIRPGMGARGRALVLRKYTWDIVGRQLDSIYRDLVQR